MNVTSKAFINVAGKKNNWGTVSQYIVPYQCPISYWFTSSGADWDAS